ncbi:MAG: proline--tRNA ligase [Thermoplasmata archaeon]|nr:MAG: proline--tRNA ligase [Thermoplasmata archaeon]
MKLNKDNFNEWYPDVIELANLSDKRYPVKGMNVWTPYGWKLMLNIDTAIRHELDSTGHGEVCFPLLIPKTEFAKEAEHIKGFDDQVYWVTRSGATELDIPLLLRPTSETAMYPIFALWIRSHSDLPLKTYQIVNTFRYETKQTRSFIRIREIHFFEAHTCHSDFEDAEAQIQEDLEIMRNLGKKLCLPYLATRRPDWDKFAGAFYTIGIDCVMPNGRVLQLASIHQYKENFSSAYGIEFEDADGSKKYVHQTTYGMSERLVGAVVGVHGDNQGLKQPPEIAPIQIVIVPILTKTARTEVLDKCNEVLKSLQEHGYSVHLDLRDIRPGNKYYDWELKGVPLRIELGPRDLKNQSIVLVRRDTGGKETLAWNDLLDGVDKTLKSVAESLYTGAQQLMDKFIKRFDDLQEAASWTGIIHAGWCGDQDCGLEMEEYLDRNILGVPIDSKDFSGSCLQCGKPTNLEIYIAKTY